MNYWLVKQEPEAYGWSQFLAEGRTAWTGIRNYQARNFLRAMKEGDWVCFYHSGSDKEIVGLARVARSGYPDPTASEGDWTAVDLEAVKALQKRVPLAMIKSDPSFKDPLLVRNSRLSVVPVTKPQFTRILELAATSC
jgi:predicted RNA-binding protein with PUA-like domain